MTKEVEEKVKRQRIHRHINVYIHTKQHTHTRVHTYKCLNITVDPLEVAPVNEGTVDCLNGSHCFFSLGVGDVGSNTGALVAVGVGTTVGTTCKCE